MINKWCFDDLGAKLFGVDKWEHVACYVVFGFLVYGWLRGYVLAYSGWYMTIVFSLVIGVAWEYFETTDVWGWLGCTWLGKRLHCCGKATCCSICDLIANEVGTLIGILLYIVLAVSIS